MLLLALASSMILERRIVMLINLFHPDRREVNLKANLPVKAPEALSCPPMIGSTSRLLPFEWAHSVQTRWNLALLGRDLRFTCQHRM